uniref:Uncharacterized protein n=1 Tax=viral metagenome TaxID=1070528 RepID=A0A6C0AXU3_9ZZZZ|tara:strand:- start:40 stop:258 length:219 start_codon:yes stop_codon:yes gene_type:complete
MTILDDCLEILKKEEVKNQIKQFCQPMVDIVMQEVGIYIYILFVLLIVNLCINIIMLFYFSRFKNMIYINKE